ncbi:MAG: agmatinase [Bacteroidia bacterium]|nr:agmatinase [Bacteroidia bacterium]
MNFGGGEVIYDYAGSGIIIVPVPYDGTSTWMKGSDKGPDAIMNASVNLEFYDIETATEVHKKGIHTIDPIVENSSPDALVNAVYKKTLQILQEKKFPVTVGGNHTVSIGAIRAFSDSYSDLSVLQLDAHSDLRQEYEGSRYNHACAMARALEYAPVVQVGIRSMAAEELPYVNKVRIFYAHELYYNKELYKKAIDQLTENVYVTIDLDVFDPSIMPSTGTPEPGGPDYLELMHFLQDVAVKKNIVGFDVVELCPSPVNKVPDFVAAKLIYQLLSYIFS